MIAATWYWLIMFAWLVVHGIWGYRTTPEGRYGVLGSGFFLFLLFLLIGYKLFGSPVK